MVLSTSLFILPHFDQPQLYDTVEQDWEKVAQHFEPNEEKDR